MTMAQADCGLVVVGASVAGVRAAVSARDSGYEGAITLIDREHYLPYDRLPLSKAFLKAESHGAPSLLSREELDRLEIRYVGGVEATGLELAAREVVTTSGPVSYARLVVAPGARPIKFAWWRDLGGVCVLRTLDDAIRVKEGLRGARDVVLIGGGFIGGEIASHAAAAGKRVTIIDAAEVPLARALGQSVGRRVLRLHEQGGVDLLTGELVTRLHGEGAVEGVELASGRVLDAQLVVVGTGVVPDTAWLAASGLVLDERDGSIVCNESLRTSDPHVWAAGDAVRWPNAVMGEVQRYENWSNAAEQGRHAGESAARGGDGAGFTTVPYFWSDWYGHRIQMVGTMSPRAVVVVNEEGDRPRYLALFEQDNRLVGAVAINCSRPVMRLRAGIASRVAWSEGLELSLALARERAQA